MFKDKLKELRMKNNLTQDSLALLIHVSRSAISKWELGNGIPSSVNLESLCSYFNVSEEYLLDREELKSQLDKTNVRMSKIIFLIIAIILSIFFSVFSSINIYHYVLKDEWVNNLQFPPHSIFSMIGNYSFIFIFIYIFNIIYSFIYFKDWLKWTEKTQRSVMISFIVITVVSFIVSFVFSSTNALKLGYGV